MARLGIDFGTTNTVAAIHDRGVISIVPHEVQTGAGAVVQDTFSSAILIQKDSDRRWFGPEAERRLALLGPEGDYVYIPSLKRQLRDYAEGRTVSTGDTGFDAQALDLSELLTEFLTAVHDSIRRSGSVPDGEDLEAVITWPANANGAQRYVTRKAYRGAGYTVLDTINEPTAAAIELADWMTLGNAKRKNQPAPSAVAVFDLGGGTFDASMVWVDGRDFRVLASAGIENLGGDDFDQVLLDLFYRKLKLTPESVSPLTRHALLRQARAQKETISSTAAKSLFLSPRDYGLKGRAVSIPVSGYDRRIKPMLEPAIATLAQVIEAAAAQQPGIDVEKQGNVTIYLVGGSSKLPLVASMVGKAFPRCRVVQSDKPFRSVAIGAAISATQQVTFRDVFARHFGLIRLKDHGRREAFDTIFPAGTPMPRRGEPPLEKVAWYEPVHNIGHLRYLECTSIGGDGMPTGSVRAWSDILFPYDPSYSLSQRPSRQEIAFAPAGAEQRICEVYRCDSDGVITVELRRAARNDSRCYEIFRD